jgi:hypothetical protein
MTESISPGRLFPVHGPDAAGRADQIQNLSPNAGNLNPLAVDLEVPRSAPRCFGWELGEIQRQARDILCNDLEAVTTGPLGNTYGVLVGVHSRSEYDPGINRPARFRLRSRLLRHLFRSASWWWNGLVRVGSLRSVTVRTVGGLRYRRMVGFPTAYKEQEES